MVLFILRESASAVLVTAAETGSIPKEPPLELLEQGTGVVTRKARREELIFFAIVANHVMLNACFMTAGQNTRKSAWVEMECKKGELWAEGCNDGQVLIEKYVSSKNS